MDNDKVAKRDWKERATAAFRKYLDALERDLPPEANIAEIEQTMLKHYQKMMSETFQILADAQEPSPPKHQRSA
jgi:hydrogenase maturation factor HypF (carbamoyltransferase family)